MEQTKKTLSSREDVAKFDDLEQIRILLECPACKITMTAPIFTCETGHHICHSCAPTLPHCYICRSPVTQLRNEFAETVSKLITNRCRFSRYGCWKVLLPEQRPEHEDICPYETVECLAADGEEAVPVCGWRGRKANLLKHVQTAHGSSFICMEQPIKATANNWTDNDSVHVRLVSALDELFWFTVKLDAKNKKRLEAVHYIGSDRRASRFQYKHELESVNRNIAITYLSTTRSIFEDVNKIFASKLCFMMDKDFFVEYFVDINKHVTGYKLTIQKVNT